MTMLLGGIGRPIAARPRGRGLAFAVIDVGSSKICCYIARARGEGGLRVIGRGYQIADGIKSGEVIDAEAAEASIRAVLHEAEQQAGETVREVAAVVGAGRPRSIHVRVERPLAGRSVAGDDVRRALARVKEELTDPEFAVLHLVPIEASVDGGRPLRDPRGIEGERLELLVHAVVGAAGPLRDLLACLDRCHVDVVGLTPAPIAAALATVSEEERERGCLVVDIGAGTTQVAHLARGQVVYVERLAKGGDRIVGDIAYGLSTSRRAAERVMNLHGSVASRAADDSTRILVPLLGDRDDEPSGEIARSRLAFIVRARLEDVLRELAGRLAAARDMVEPCPPRSIVLTGGVAQVDGIAELAEELFGLPARVGRPAAVGGLAAEATCCAAAIGGLLQQAGKGAAPDWWRLDEAPTITHGIARVKEWLRQNF